MDIPITQQPSSGFSTEVRNPDNLPGLDKLSFLNEVTVRQDRAGFLEVAGWWEHKNRYEVLDQDGTVLFIMKEESDCCTRIYCGNGRDFKMTFEDTDGQVLLDFDRPLRCQDCCCTGCYPNWTQLMEVKHKEQMVGKIREVPNGCCGNVELQVQDRHDLKLLGISGPCCPCGCCGADVPFQIEDDAGSSVGQIARKWRGCCEETFTDSDTFKVEFPSGSDVTKKALLIAATILIDFMYFEDPPNNEDNGDNA